MWAQAIPPLGTIALLLDGLGRPADAATLVAARAANGFDTGFGKEVIQAMADRIAADHPDEIDGWRRAGERLDNRAAAELAVAVIDRALADATPTTGN